MTGFPDVWADYNKGLSFVTKLADGVFEWLDPQPGQRILDVGCGDGTHVKKMVDMGVDAFGIDPSPDQIAACRMAGLDAERVRQASAEDMPDYGKASFDAVFSNAAFHYFRRPVTAFQNIGHILKPGGRLVVEMGGSFSGDLALASQSNVQILQEAIKAAAPASMDVFVMTDEREGGFAYHPTVDSLARILTKVNLTLQSAQLFARPTPVPPDTVLSVIRIYTSNLIGRIPPDERESFLRAAAAYALPRLPKTPQGEAILDYKRLRFIAVQ